MKDGFKCAHCGAVNYFTLYTRKRWEQPTPQRCTRCGASHACHRGSVEVISPVMQPMVKGNLKLSPWYPPEYRPIYNGNYEVEFFSGYRRELYWNGRYFQPHWKDARRVVVNDLLKWRGVWA